MSLPIVTIRPPPGDAATAVRAASMGLTVMRMPLFAVDPVGWQVPEIDCFDALLIGSANALRHGGEGLSTLTSLPAYAVGEATARKAREAGFSIAAIGSRGLQTVLDDAKRAGHCRLLRLSGEAHVPLAPPPGVTVSTIVAYRVAALPIPDDLAECLGAGALVLLHSGEAAAHFAAEVDRLALPRERIALACLAPCIARRAGDGWARCAIAERIDDGALLALAGQMCKKQAEI